MLVLGIETSCDESAVAIVDDKKNILAHQVLSQINKHQPYGGVIPELAARSHLEVIDFLINKTLQQANIELTQIDGFASTCGPGLIGGVIVGMTCAKTLAAIYQKPFLAINHLAGHALTVRLTSNISFPYLLLLVSGGHCQIIIAFDINSYLKIGETIDDALGEAFDKVAQMIGLPYPGGPQVEKLALSGNIAAYNFPKPLIDNKNHQHLFDFSFSGLKTAVRREIEKITASPFDPSTSASKISLSHKADICASFQNVVAEILIDRLKNVINHHEYFNNKNSNSIKNLVIAGGVSANKYLFNRLKQFTDQNNLSIYAPPLDLCTDNASMIAWVGIEKLQRNLHDHLNFTPRAKWDL